MLRRLAHLPPQTRDFLSDLAGVIAICMVIGSAMVVPGLI
jgi:hypothetical protein